jgi:hypothetical protein
LIRPNFLPKINRIDVNYFRRNPKLDISDETKLNADVKSSEEFYAETVEGKDNFITEVFFLNMAANHYGLGTTEIQYEGLCKDIPEMERHLERIKEDREKYIGVRTLLKTCCIMFYLTRHRHRLSRLWTGISRR